VVDGFLDGGLLGCKGTVSTSTLTLLYSEGSDCPITLIALTRANTKLACLSLKGISSNEIIGTEHLKLCTPEH
jgi:hypothetical protein